MTEETCRTEVKDEVVPWTLAEAGFSATLDGLPGCEADEVADALLGEMRYPRFCAIDGKERLFECRVGMVGKGSYVLFRYGMAEEATWTWRSVGRYLVGEGCSRISMR